ncbi:NONE-like protein [Apodospora peruviana]|uniref:Mitochondrial genome maintenance protein MGM101 n=1 Tax=Apodospora peruviana TaxID=516989 RepID=A0AAE0I0T8_9PEZI|nr:NONE-like protein [Apodospora peruviana]
MSKEEKRTAAAAAAAQQDDEPDEWDKRIFSTGCAVENTKLTDCYFEKKDWRLCKAEIYSVSQPEAQAPKQFQTRQNFDGRTSYGYLPGRQRPSSQSQPSLSHQPPRRQASHTMNSRALQACRPLSLTSSSFQYLLRPAFTASASTSATSSSSTATPAAAAAAAAADKDVKEPPQRKSAYTKPSQQVIRTTQPQYKNASPRLSAPRSTSSSRIGVIDPQAAVPKGPKASEVDAELASNIPTPGTPYAPSVPAFRPAAGVESGFDENGNPIDWSSSYHGLATTPFTPETAAILMAPINPDDVEMKPDGIIYLPEIKYRRILNVAFGPGGWGLAPRGDLIVADKVVTREYALVVNGRFVAQARGECNFFSEEQIPTAGEGCKSNALMRCCKDLGIASELWDPRFIRTFKKTHCHEVWVEHVVTKKKKQIWLRKDCDPSYPFAISKGFK